MTTSDRGVAVTLYGNQSSNEVSRKRLAVTRQQQARLMDPLRIGDLVVVRPRQRIQVWSSLLKPHQRTLRQYVREDLLHVFLGNTRLREPDLDLLFEAPKEPVTEPVVEDPVEPVVEEATEEPIVLPEPTTKDLETISTITTLDTLELVPADLGETSNSVVSSVKAKDIYDDSDFVETAPLAPHSSRFSSGRKSRKNNS